jgi:hypothetical protein
MTVSGLPIFQVVCLKANLAQVSLPASFNVWLASPEARFLKGKFLWANWDVDELKARAAEIEAGTLLSVGLVGWPFQDAGWKLQSAWQDSSS